MNNADRAHHLASAVEQARQAYRALTGGVTLPNDRDLARSNDYRALLRAGHQIRTLTCREVFLKTKMQLFSDDPVLSARAATDLDHLWAGLADWPESARRNRLH